MKVAHLILSGSKGLNVANYICMGGGAKLEKYKKMLHNSWFSKGVMWNCIFETDQENSYYQYSHYEVKAEF